MTRQDETSGEVTQASGMDAALKAKWVEALRSGRYAQGRACLRDDEDRYCCLGVLCDVAGATWRFDDYVGEYVATFGEDSNSVTLPYDLADRQNISADTEQALWKLNDLRKASFATIADYIEQHIPTSDDR